MNVCTYMCTGTHVMGRNTFVFSFLLHVFRPILFRHWVLQQKQPVTNATHQCRHTMSNIVSMQRRRSCRTHRQSHPSTPCHKDEPPTFVLMLSIQRYLHCFLRSIFVKLDAPPVLAASANNNVGGWVPHATCEASECLGTDQRNELCLGQVVFKIFRCCTILCPSMVGVLHQSSTLHFV